MDLGCGAAEELMPFRATNLEPLIGVDLAEYDPVPGLTLHWNTSVCGFEFLGDMAAILAVNLVHHLDQRCFERVVAQAVNALVPGGLFVILSYHTGSDSRGVPFYPFDSARYELVKMQLEEVVSLANHPFAPGFNRSNNGLWVFGKK